MPIADWSVGYSYSIQGTTRAASEWQTKESNAHKKGRCPERCSGLAVVDYLSTGAEATKPKLVACGSTTVSAIVSLIVSTPSPKSASALTR